MSAVCDCLFNIFAATLHTGGHFSNRKLRMCHAVLSGTHLFRLHSYYDGFIVTNHSEDVLSPCIISTAAYFLLFFIPKIIMKGHISRLALVIANSMF